MKSITLVALLAVALTACGQKAAEVVVTTQVVAPTAASAPVASSAVVAASAVAAPADAMKK